MTDLLKDLEAVAGLADKATPGEWVTTVGHHVKQAHGVMVVAKNELRGEVAQHNAAYIATLHNFIRTHHAEIAEAVKDAERWRALHWAEAPMVTVTGSQLARGIRPGDYAVPWDWPVTSMTRIRMIVMNDSAREAGE
jgi:hypothetical protein